MDNSRSDNSSSHRGNNNSGQGYHGRGDYQGRSCGRGGNRGQGRVHLTVDGNGTRSDYRGATGAGGNTFPEQHIGAVQDVSNFDPQGEQVNLVRRVGSTRFVKGSLNGFSTEFLMDMGATVSIISRELATKAGLMGQLRPTTAKPKGINKMFLDVDGEVEVDLVLGDKHDRHVFLVARNLNATALLGMDYLEVDNDDRLYHCLNLAKLQGNNHRVCVAQIGAISCRDEQGISVKNQKATDEEVADALNVFHREAVSDSKNASSLFLRSMGIKKMRSKQRSDLRWRANIAFLETGVMPSSSRDVKRLEAHKDLFSIDKKGILYRRRIDVSNKGDWRSMQLVVPRYFARDVFDFICKKSNAHVDFQTIYHGIRDAFYWPEMRSDIWRWCQYKDFGSCFSHNGNG